LTVATNKRSTPFSHAAKQALEVGKELTDGNLIWRKLKDGTGSWRYDFMLNGTRHKGVIGAERNGVTLSQARSHLAKIKAQAVVEGLSRKAGAPFQEARLFSDVAEEFIEWSKSHHRDHRHNVSRLKNHLLPYLGERKLGDITTATVEKLRSALLSQELERQTVKRVVSLLSSVYEFARKSDSMLVNPTRNLSRLKVQEKEMQVFTRDETERLLLLGASNSRDRVLVGLALFAGLRASEALGLTWEHVDLERNEITIGQNAKEGDLEDMTKSYKARVVPINLSLKAILLEHRESTRKTGLLLSNDGEKPYYQVQHMFNRIKERAGLDTGATYHGLRHTFATRVVEKGIDLPTLQQWMGHADITVTMRYVHTNNDHMKRMAALLD
jgi:integrase